MEKLKGKDNEINKAILEWLNSKNYTSTVNSFLSDTCLSLDDMTTGNSLEKRWNTILTLQKKVYELEAQLKQAKEDLENSSGPYSLTVKENLSMGIPKAPAKATIKGHRGAVTCLQFHPYFNLLATGSEDACIIIWECEEFLKEKSIKAHSNTINALAFDNGKYLASCSSDLLIKIWNFDTMTCYKTLAGHEHTVSSIEFSPDGNFLISASRDKSIRIWEVTTGNCKRILSEHNDWVRSVSLNSTGNLLASSSDDESIIIWNLDNFNSIHTLNGHENKIESVIFLKSPTAIANVYNSDYVEKFNKSLIEETQHEILNRKLLEKANKKEIKINKEYILSASRDKTIKLWDVFGSICLFTFNGHDNWVRSIVIHPNGKYFVSCGDDKSIRVWELENGRCVKKIIDSHDRFVVGLAVSVKFMMIASGSNDQTIKIWDCK